MPAYCAPPPGNMKTTSGASPTRLWVKTRRGSLASSSAAASSWLAATSDPALLEGAPALLEREGDVGERLLGVRAQVRRERLGVGVERGARARREHQQLERPVRRLGLGRARRLLEHRVGVGAADAERVHAGPARALRVVQSVRRALTRNGLVSKSIAGFGLSKPRLGGICRCCSASAALIRLATPAAVSRWPMLVLTEPMRQKPRGLGGLAERRGQRRDLDRVAEVGAGAVALDVVDRVGGDAGDRVRLGDRRAPGRRRSARGSRPCRRRRC